MLLLLQSILQIHESSFSSMFNMRWDNTTKICVFTHAGNDTGG